MTCFFDAEWVFGHRVALKGLKGILQVVLRMFAMKYDDVGVWKRH